MSVVSERGRDRIAAAFARAAAAHGGSPLRDPSASASSPYHGHGHPHAHAHAYHQHPYGAQGPHMQPQQPPPRAPGAAWRHG